MAIDEELHNSFVAALSTGEHGSLQPFLRRVTLRQGAILFGAGSRIRRVYLPVGAVVSLLVTSADGSTVETAMIGRDGGIGIAAALYSDIAIHDAMVLIGGTAFVVPPEALRRLAARSAHVREMMYWTDHAACFHAHQAAACIANHSIESRLCSWLLRIYDRIGSNELHVTHEIVARMLGVRRESITTHAKRLHEKGMIESQRGLIVVVDRDAVYHRACECYDVRRRAEIASARRLSS